VSPVLRYTASRVLMFIVVATVLALLGARGLLLVALALVVSGLLSFVLLSSQRDAMSAAVVGSSRRLRRRMDARASREDEADDAWRAEHGDPAPGDRP
jgi:hypothetical protein